VEKDWKKVTSNPGTQCKDFVNCDDNPSTTARMTIQEIHRAADKDDKAADSQEAVSAESPIPSFEMAVSGFEAVQMYVFLQTLRYQLIATGPAGKGDRCTSFIGHAPHSRHQFWII
jgi:hypothetical protein